MPELTTLQTADFSAAKRLFKREEFKMGICVTCGNTYDKTFTVITSEGRYEFDSFECAIHELAPRCAHCGCHIIGHGVENRDAIFCCAHCAEQVGDQRFVDRK